MQILVTNDDGILAPGIQELARSLAALGEVIISAPMEEKSAIGHGITVRDPIRIKPMSFPGIIQAWAVDGTPADCVKLAVQELICEECSLIISGINNGPNLGTDVLYSGTVSAAIEGAILGLPSIAVSLASYEAVDYKTAAEVARIWPRTSTKTKPDPAGHTSQREYTRGLREELKGFKITKLGVRVF